MICLAVPPKAGSKSITKLQNKHKFYTQYVKNYDKSVNYATYCLRIHLIPIIPQRRHGLSRLAAPLAAHCTHTASLRSGATSCTQRTRTRAFSAHLRPLPPIVDLQREFFVHADKKRRRAAPRKINSSESILLNYRKISKFTTYDDAFNIWIIYPVIFTPLFHLTCLFLHYLIFYTTR